MRRRVVLGTVVLLVLAAGAGLWWWTRDRGPQPLEPGWPALVTTLAGDGTRGHRDGWRNSARFSDPFGITVGPDGTIYVADAGGSPAVRRIDADGHVSTVSTTALEAPSAIAVDGSGVLYVADTGADAIVRISPDGATSRLADAADGLNGPVGVAVDAAGRVIVADTYNDRIVAIAPDGSVTPLAGIGTPGFADGPAASASFDTPTGVAVDPGGTIYVADLGNGAVRVITPSGDVRTIAPGSADPFIRPMAVAVAAGGEIYVADDRGRILELVPSGGLRIVAGSGAGYEDGDGTTARFRGPSGVAVLAEGRLVVSDRRNALVRLIEAPTRAALRPPPPPLRTVAFDEQAFGRAPILWPFVPFEGPFEITGTLGEPRGSGADRLHAGLDVYAPEGEPVHVVRDGVVDHPLATFDFGTINESMRIGPIAYIHMRVGRMRRDEPMADSRFVFTRDEAGKVQRVRVKRGSRFAAGEAIGTVNRFYHVHLNIGAPGEEVNPLHFQLPHHVDTVPPTIPRGGVQLVGLDGVPLKARVRGRLLVNTPVRIVVDAWDQVDGNETRRRLGLYRLGYGVLPVDPSAPALPVQETLRFDRQPIDPEAPRLIYAAGSGIPVYGNRRTRFLYNVTTTYQQGVASDGVFDPGRIEPGDYTLRILAADLSGNEARANRDLAIRIVASGSLGER